MWEAIYVSLCSYMRPSGQNMVEPKYSELSENLLKQGEAQSWIASFVLFFK